MVQTRRFVYAHARARDLDEGETRRTKRLSFGEMNENETIIDVLRSTKHYFFSAMSENGIAGGRLRTTRNLSYGTMDETAVDAARKTKRFSSARANKDLRLGSARLLWSPFVRLQSTRTSSHTIDILTMVRVPNLAPPRYVLTHPQGMIGHRVHLARMYHPQGLVLMRLTSTTGRFPRLRTSDTELTPHIETRKAIATKMNLYLRPVAGPSTSMIRGKPTGCLLAASLNLSATIGNR